VDDGKVFRLAVGLGNPGRDYAETRHNVGFLVLDELARRAASSFAFEPKWNSDLASCGGRALMKPQTFMNLSGEAVGDYARYFKLSHEEILIILDDVSLPLGKLRLRTSGSSGGQNGLESVLIHLGTEAIPRLRVGIGSADGRPLQDHVLGRFTSTEEPLVQQAITRAADAFEYANARGINAAMNQYNHEPKEL